MSDAEHADAVVATKHAGAGVRGQTGKQRVFLTFAAGDLALASPVAAGLLAGGSFSLDQGQTSEPFASVRGEIIRASLRARLRHCASALCLYGSRTANDDWVKWVLTSAAELRLPLLGAALPGEDGWQTERILTGLGAEIIPLSREAIAERTVSYTSHRLDRTESITAIIETLRLMRHPLR